MIQFSVLAACLAFQAAPPANATPPAAFEFPPGAVSDAVAQLTLATIPAETPQDLGRKTQVPALSNRAWQSAETWSHWSALVELEGQSVHPDPERRARLALLAGAQGRAEDAWQHTSQISDPRWLAAILPVFLPGVPAESAIGSGGAGGALADGVVLSPSLPPSSQVARTDGRVDRRAMSVRSFQVGRAFVSMRVSVEAEGVQIDVKHLSGESAKLSVVIPSSADYAFADEYVDWYRQDTMRVPHAIELEPGEAEHTIYGRFEPRAKLETSGVPRALPGSVREGGVWFTLPLDDPDRALLVKIAETIDARGFGFHLGVREITTKTPSFSGVTFALDDVATRAEKLAWLASAIERFVLSPAPR
ncbi:MAG: hypothetical protein SGI72_15965 [Planctomycetota bacterium]|nr:hypothetical protein [Planctomycetota bacterium]